MTEWREETAAALGRAIGAGRLDPRDLAEACLEAVAAAADGARIFARLTPERARAEAAAAATRAREGRRLGPLDGVPLAWKDNIDSAGVATEAGSRLLAGRVPEADATVLGRASAAGLVCLGKTHLSELAFSGLGVNPMAATPETALMPGRAPGGSSSGSAVAVARRLAPAAIGTDTGGSVRIPAAWNGLVGLKTTPGVLPNDGVVPLAASLDTVGPIARTCEDAALVLAALLGTPAEPLPEPAPPEALLVPEPLGAEGADPEPIAAWEAGLDRLAAGGIALSRGDVPELAQTRETGARLSPVVTYEAWQTWGAKIEAAPGTMYPRIETRFRLGATVSAEDDRAARAEFARLSRSLAARIAEGGLLALPTVPILPPEIARLEAEEAHYTERNLMALSITRLVNLLGLPAITLPLPETACGMMLVAGPGQEARLLAAGMALEGALLGPG